MDNKKSPILSLRRKILFASFTLIFLLGAFFGLVEIILRLKTPANLEQRLRKIEVDEMQAQGAGFVRRGKMKTMYANSPTLGYKLVANFETTLKTPEYKIVVKTNSLGMREQEIDSTVLDPAGMRVLTLGDSFVFGLGVEREQTFQSLLEEQLRARYNRPVEVLNSGVPGYGTSHSAIVLEELFPVVKPNLVLGCFYVGNDLIDDLHCMKHGVTSQRVVNGVFISKKRYHIKSDQIELDDVQNPLKRFLLQSSFAYNYFDMKIAGLMVQTGMRPKPITLYKSVYKFHCKEDSEEETKVYDLTKRLLTQMRDTCRQGGSRFVLVLFPAKLQIVPGLFQEQLRGFGVSQDDYSIDKPNQRMREIARELDIPILDLYEPFRARAGERLYYEQDGHWTDIGHRLAADEIHRFLIELK